jgi:hypothetical protein
MHWLESVHSGSAIPEEDALVEDDDVLVDEDEEVLDDDDDALDDVIAPPPPPPGPAPPPGVDTLLPHATSPASETTPKPKQSRARILRLLGRQPIAIPRRPPA